MWLLFYVMDSLSVKLLQEGKQAIQRQPFLHNANLPTSIPTDNHPSVSHREFENIYKTMPHSSTSVPTEKNPSVIPSMVVACYPSAWTSVSLHYAGKIVFVLHVYLPAIT